MVASTAFCSSIPPHSPATERSARTSAAQEEAVVDTQLVHRFNAGEEKAFVEITTRYHRKLFAIAFALLRNRADAEEIAQDALIRAHRGLARFRGESTLATWLYRIALNLSRNRYWYNHRRRQYVSQSFDTAFSDDNQTTLASLVASSAPSPVNEVATKEFAELVTVCMERLGPSHREILHQRNNQNCSYGEIARALGISIGTVKSRIARARENLRILLTEACPEFERDASPGEWFDPVRPSGRMDVISA